MRGAEDSIITRITADPDHITLTLDLWVSDNEVRLYALTAHETVDQPGDPLTFEPTEPGTIRVRRMHDGRDLLFSRFVVGLNGNEPTGSGRWVTEIKNPTDPDTPAWPEGIKGVSNPEDLDDLVALGVKHVHINILLGNLLLPEGAADPPEQFIHTVNGVRLRFRPGVIARYDREISRMTRDGINVVAVFLNHVGGDATARGLVHPATDVANAPFKLGAFNLTTDQGIATYVGTLSYLAERYSRPDAKWGRLGGYIIGNEVDSHWMWHNLGEADLDTVARQYIAELRLAWLAIRRHSAAPGVFVSLTHSWTRPNSQLRLRNTAGKDLLDRLTELSREGGDFGWDVAYHPYPAEPV